MNAGEIVVTLDIGGSGLKLAAYSLDQHHCVAASVTPWPQTSWSTDGTEFDVQSWWQTTLTALAAMVARLNRGSSYTVVGVTVGAVRIPFVLLDEDDAVLRPCLSNSDRRATEMVRQLRASYGDESFYRATGHWLTPEFGLPKLLWLRQMEPALFDATHRVAQLHDWFIFQLCGAWCSEASSAAMSQLVSAEAEDWSTEILDEFGLSRDWLPDLQASGTQVGSLRPAVAASVGLPTGVPVHVGGGDTQLSALGVGALAEASPEDRLMRPVVVAGTTVPVQWAFPFNPQSAADVFPLLVSRQLLSGWWSVEANAGGIGATLDRLRRLDPQLSGTPLMLALQTAHLCAMPDDLIASELMVTLGNPVFGPASWDDAPVGRIYGLRPEHNAADVYRAALNGSALAVLAMLSSAPAGFAFSETIMMTGGLTANLPWVQLVADLCGRTLLVPDPETAGIAGAALVTGRDLWTAADTAACRRYSATDYGGSVAYAQAYTALWSQIQTGTEPLTGVSTCAH